MTKKAIAPHLKKVLQDYLNNVKNADKTLLEKPFIPDTSADIVRNIEQCLISSYLLGQIHAEEENPERKINAGDGDIPPVPFAEAIDFLKARVPMTKKEWEKLEPKLRFRAFTVTKLGTAVEIETAKQVLISALEKGESYSQTWEMMNDIFGKGELGFKAGYWENVFRTNTQTAYMAGKLQQYEKTPGIAAYQLMIIEDDRTSKICRNLLTKTGRGLVLSVDDDFWKTKGFPPYHFQCRSSVRAVYQHQLKAENIKIDHPKHLDRFKPGEGFGGNPLTDGNWWKLTSSQAKIARKIGIEADLSRKEELIKMATEQIRMLNQKESG
ncbi:MAG: minor capsid protein [Spirochaetia bacterium]|nr:minor capsid protein [Spirochaetia bacterium]